MRFSALQLVVTVSVLSLMFRPRLTDLFFNLVFFTN